jgi:hypothetical protein
MSNIPKFSYSSWLVEFMFIHSIFSVVAMFEFAFISYLDFRAKMAKERQAKKEAKEKKR